jgi:hypothetical protein
MEPDLLDAGVALSQSIPTPPHGIEDIPAQAASMFDMTSLLTQWNGMLIVAVWVAIQSLKRALPDEWFDDGKTLARVMPLFPIIATSIAVWIPGPWLDPHETAAQRIILGIILGAMTSQVHTIMSRLGLHDLLGVEADTRKLTKKAPAEDAPKTAGTADPITVAAAAPPSGKV